MLDGAVEEPQLDTANGLPATTWAGESQPHLTPLIRPACQSVLCSMLCRCHAAAASAC